MLYACTDGQAGSDLHSCLFVLAWDASMSPADDRATSGPGAQNTKNGDTLRYSKLMECAGKYAQVQSFYDCPQCSYTFVGLHSGHPCPECGLPVVRSALVMKRWQSVHWWLCANLIMLLTVFLSWASHVFAWRGIVHLWLLIIVVPLPVVVTAIVQHPKRFRWVGLAPEGVFVARSRRHVVHVSWDDLGSVDTRSSRYHVVLRRVSGEELLRLGWRYLTAARLMKLFVDLARLVVEHGDTSFLPDSGAGGAIQIDSAEESSG